MRVISVGLPLPPLFLSKIKKEFKCLEFGTKIFILVAFSMTANLHVYKQIFP